MLVFPGHKCGSLQLVVSDKHTDPQSLFLKEIYQLFKLKVMLKLFFFFSRTYPTPSLVHHLPPSPSTPTRVRSPAWRSTSRAVWQRQPLAKERLSACLTQRPETSWWSCAEEPTRPPFTGKHWSSDG